MKTQKIPSTETYAKATAAARSERLLQRQTPRRRKLTLLLAIAAMLLAAIPAQATIVINASEVGNDVVFELSGGVNMGSLVLLSTSNPGTGLVPTMDPSIPLIQMVPSASTNDSWVYDSFTASEVRGPSSFGFGEVVFVASSSAGAPFMFSLPHDGLPFNIGFFSGYAGIATYSTMTFANANFGTLEVVPGTYEWTWTAGGVSDNLILNIGQSTPNQAPTANAGLDQSIHAGNTVNLDGSLSYDDNTAATSLQYSWSFTERPAGSSATLSNADTATPRFVSDLDGNYVVRLVVTDEEGLASAPDQVLISSYNQAPTACATVSTTLPMVENPVTLDGSTSTDPDGDPLNYNWTVTSQPAGSVAAITEVDAHASVAGFTPDVAGEYVITLTVSDFLGAGTPASVTLVASDAAQFAEGKIMDAAAIVAALPRSQITQQGNRKELENLLRIAVKDLRNGDVAGAIDQLNQAINRTDGCALRGAPDGSGPGFDWISDCGGQAPVYDDLTAAFNALQG